MNSGNVGFSKPRVVQFGTINKCNAKCSFCPVPSLNNKLEVMSDTIFEKIIRDSKEIQPKLIYPFLFGEPFLDKKIIERIKTINFELPNTKIGLFTNASLINSDLVEQLSQVNIYSINISINAISKETYKSIMGFDYDKTLNNIEELLSLKDKIKLSTSLVKTKKNIKEINTFKRFWEKKGLTVLLQEELNWTGWSKLKSQKTNCCYKLLTTIVIKPNGQVILCCQDYAGKVVLGNILKNSLLDIWNNKKTKEYRQKHLFGERDKLFLCSECNV